MSVDRSHCGDDNLVLSGWPLLMRETTSQTCAVVYKYLFYLVGKRNVIRYDGLALTRVSFIKHADMR